MGSIICLVGETKRYLIYNDTMSRHYPRVIAQRQPKILDTIIVDVNVDSKATPAGTGL